MPSDETPWNKEENLNVQQTQPTRVRFGVVGAPDGIRVEGFATHSTIPGRI